MCVCVCVIIKLVKYPNFRQTYCLNRDLHVGYNDKLGDDDLSNLICDVGLFATDTL